jgi:MFS family permease
MYFLRIKLGKNVTLFGWISFLTDVASDMIYPLLPAFLTAVLGASAEALGLIEGVAEATSSLLKVASGSLSDRIRRRKPLVVAGYSLAALARPLIALATAWPQVLAIRFSDRFGKGIRTAPRDAMIAADAPPDARGFAFGYQRAMDNAGAFLGPILAALLLKFAFSSVRPVFALSLIPAGIAVVLLMWGVRENRPGADRPTGRQGWSHPAAGLRTPLPRSFWLIVAIVGAFTLSNSTDAFLLLKAQHAGIPAWSIPLLWAGFNGARAIGGMPGGALSDRIGRGPAILAGWTVYAATYFGFAAAKTPIAIIGLFAAYAVFYALTEGAERAFVADMVPAQSRGRAYGIYHGVVGVAALPASLLCGWLWETKGSAMAFRVDALLSLAAAAALAAAIVRPKRGRS